MKLKIKKIIGFYPNDKKTGQPNEDNYGTYTAVWMFVEGQDGVFTGKARAGSPMLSFKDGDEVDLVITGEKQVGDKKYVNFRLAGGAKASVDANIRPVQTSKSESKGITPTPTSAPNQGDSEAFQIAKQTQAEVNGLRKRIEDLENLNGSGNPF